ncbi:acetyl-CoA carboxylase biotin carboxyl carrier protein subunit [Enterococcus saigonensis]|uniref:Acetyl-CoA carboxylase biotin carboxyl carrier protein subunit n=1 Tax=Enterococcus saigonensis TaxID=1805431 RepID=A0A679IST0_9ENTE|nr:acetyl-CoA carboxylase biotin carboxyl carrier protein subunit [Enterococcus saigonensis]BCA86577.1 acetyl-CoA carboxylase biotin carboxyl carrier protein subunit [Enterococcus saigonensis]
MLRKFKISIDGKEYLVEMEELGVPAVQEERATTSVTEPKPAPTLPTMMPPQAKNSTVSSESQLLTAPMPGTILKLLVNPGESVSANQPVMILEAMKMENEIVAPTDGHVAEILVQVGTIVNASDPLISFN